jgi:cell division protein FtsL
MLSKILLYIGVFLLFALLLLANYVSILRHKNQILAQQNEEFKKAQIIQQDVININDENIQKSNDLSNKITIQTLKIKELNVVNQEEFIKKSNCIFSNFGVYDAKC